VLKEKFTRQIMNADVRPIAFAELHPETGIALMLECLPPKPPAPGVPPKPPPREMPKDMVFLGIPLRANDAVPRGDMWLRGVMAKERETCLSPFPG
jgi:hypothetical protein